MKKITYNFTSLSPNTFFSQELRQTSSLRWVFLLLCCFSTLGDYYCFDNVGATHSHLKSQISPHLSSPSSFEYYYSMLYSLYSFPNLILPFLGGILIDVFGCRIMYIIFAITLVIGQFIFACGSQINSISVMLMGRAIFGIEGESVTICQAAISVKWFFKNSISLPMGLTLTISRLGSVLNDILSPRFSKDDNVTNAYWFGLIVCFFSFICTLILCLIDYAKDKAMKDIDELDIPDKKDTSINTHHKCVLFESILSFNSLFWIMCVICLLLYGTVLPFNYIATAFFCSTSLSSYSENEARNIAGIYMGVPFLLSAPMVPLISCLIDKFGKRANMALISGVLCVISFFLFYIMTPLVPLIFLGVTYSIFAAVIWPSLTIVIYNERTMGIAYGVESIMQNLGMAINPIIIAGIYMKYNSYYACLIYFGILGMIAVLMSLLLIRLNKKNNLILNKVTFEEDTKKSLRNTVSIKENRSTAMDSSKDHPLYDMV